MSVPPVTGPAAPNADRPLSAAEAAAELRQRRAEQAREARSTDREEPPPEEPVRTPVAESARKDAIRPYRVTLDPETSRLTTEVVDTQTGEVLLRIPPESVFRMPEHGAADGSRPGGPAQDGEGELVI